MSVHCPRARGALALAALAIFGARPAAAHIQLVYPPQRTEDQKIGPCGNGGGARSGEVTVLRSGQTLVVEWDETVEHPGHFRISFDDDGDDDFAAPASFTDSYTNERVLVDLIADRATSGGDRHYRQEVTLPDVECEACTLQVIQVMTDKGPKYGDNDLYFQCADVALRRDAKAGGAAPGPGGGAAAGPSGGGASGGGCAQAGAGRTGAAGAVEVGAALAALAALGGGRRGRRRAAPTG
jgi:hypothetical protein